MTTAIFWFTLDLRLQDLPGLAAAMRQYDQVVPIFILDRQDPWFVGRAGQWWLHRSLEKLSSDIARQGGQLVLRSGATLSTLLQLIQQSGATALHVSRAYEPWLAATQQQVFQTLATNGVVCKRYAGRLLLEPEQILNQQGKPFQVFTPYYKHCLKSLSLPPNSPALKPRWFTHALASERLADWALLPTKPNWAKGFEEWEPGEAGAQKTLRETATKRVVSYAARRDQPATDGTSRLSPHLHFGEISPRAIWHGVSHNRAIPAGAGEPFLRQLIWREFSFYLLHHWPHIPERAFKAAFERFPWTQNAKALEAWQRGETGYPIVDAGMRELWQTGWMHNRVRMIVASFLTKHLQIHWREGAAWFWDTLVDADLANNTAGWQWVAGSGADAAPYFRIFNPVLQGEKLDRSGDYVRAWVPELAQLPAKYIHKPWLAPSAVLQVAGVQLGKNYPAPIVNHEQARQTALAAYALIRSAGGS
jgi:deoxyribodipyrimidine photo-lyase